MPGYVINRGLGLRVFRPLAMKNHFNLIFIAACIIIYQQTADFSLNSKLCSIHCSSNMTKTLISIMFEIIGTKSVLGMDVILGTLTFSSQG